jgi:hypothetical protein
MQALDNANVSLVYVRDRSGSIRYRIDSQLQDTICLVYDLSHSSHSTKNEVAMGANGNNGTHYTQVDRSAVPQGRKGKHRKAVTDILSDLGKLNPKQAVRIPLSSLNGEKMQNLRSALNRVTREKNIPVVTSSDEKYLYVWREERPSAATE